MKGLRAVDFLAPLYAKERVGKFTSALEDVQDCLGLIHDDTTGRKIAGALNLDRIELTDAHDRARRLKIVSKRFKHLNRVGRFWANRSSAMRVASSARPSYLPVETIKGSR